MITVYGFGNVTPEVKGITRDLRALWGLEESGLAYRVHPLDDMRGELSGADYIQINPFGRVPAIDDDGFKLFESGAILFYIADKSGTLLPQETRQRALATQWAFAALDTIEPAMTDLAAIDKFSPDAAWAKERRPMLVKRARANLEILEAELAGRRHLLGDAFTLADILLVSVLRFIQHTDLLADVPVVAAYKARCEARPAWKRALAAYEARFPR